MSEETPTKIKARQHKSHTSYTIVTILLPVIGFILGIVYLAKDNRLDKKLGEHLLALSILLFVVYGVILSLIAAGVNNNGNVSNAAQTGPSGYYGSSSSDNTQDNTSDNSAGSTPPAPTPQPTVLLDQSGSGQAETKPFTTTGQWQITYTFDCSSFGQAGNFQYYIDNTDNSLNTDTGANDLAASGGNTNYYYDAGEHYLQVNSECDWHVIVKG